MSDFELEYQWQDGSPAKVPITEQPKIFGRNVGAEVVIDWDPAMSGRHFQVFIQGEQLCLADLGSTNGTFVNGQRVTECQVVIGDRIRAGNTMFQVIGIRQPSSAAEASLSTDSVYLSDSDFNVLKTNSSDFVVLPPQVDEVGTAKSESVGVWGTSTQLSEPARTGKVERWAEFSWTLADGAGSKIRLRPDEKLEIGRAPECEICLAHDPYGTWNHCQVEWCHDECWLTDLKSVGGTWIDGLHRSTCRLNGAGTIRVGRSEIRFQINGSESAPNATVVQDLAPPDVGNAVQAVPVVVETCLSGLQRMRFKVPEPESRKPISSQTPASNSPTIASLVAKLQRLLEKQQALFVVDFSRIEERPPADLKLSAASPFAELGDFVAMNLPVIMTAEEFVQWPVLLDELWDRDACLVLFTELPKAEFVSSVSELRKLPTTASRRIPATSYGLFWPSILDAILFSNVQKLADRFASLCSLILMEVPLQPGRWQAFGTAASITRLAAGESFRVVKPTVPRTDGSANVDLEVNCENGVEGAKSAWPTN